MKVKPHFHKKGFVLGLILKVRVFGTRKWPVSFESCVKACISVFPFFKNFFLKPGLVKHFKSV